MNQPYETPSPVSVIARDLQHPMVNFATGADHGDAFVKACELVKEAEDKGGYRRPRGVVFKVDEGWSAIVVDLLD